MLLIELHTYLGRENSIHDPSLATIVQTNTYEL